MGRELTRQEKAAIRSLVVKWCANYDREYGCLPLECECYMFGKCWTGSFCRYFREAVLPLDPALEAALLTEGPRPDFKLCPECGGAGWYFKICRPKQEKAAGPEEDYGDELEDYDGGDDMPPWDEDEPEEMEDEE